MPIRAHLVPTHDMSLMPSTSTAQKKRSRMPGRAEKRPSPFQVKFTCRHTGRYISSTKRKLTWWVTVQRNTHRSWRTVMLLRTSSITILSWPSSTFISNSVKRWWWTKRDVTYIVLQGRDAGPPCGIYLIFQFCSYEFEFTYIAFNASYVEALSIARIFSSIDQQIILSSRWILCFRALLIVIGQKFD